MIDLDGVLYPAIFERLDVAFPEFGWVRDSKGWRATNEQVCKSVIGASKRRVVSHRPMGFYAHGSGFKTWIDYVSNERSPRGEAFISAVQDLCGRAGIAYTARQLSEEEIQVIEEKKQRTSLLEDIWSVVRYELSIEDLNARKEYLKSRDLNPEPDALDVGYCGSPAALRAALHDRGYTDQDLSLVGLTFIPKSQEDYAINSTWTNRIIGKLVSQRKKLEGFWLRATGEEKNKYVYSTGFNWTEHPISRPYGSSARAVLVEGVFEPEIFGQSIPDLASIGGTGSKCTPEFWGRLHHQGIKTAVLLLDNDEPGRKGLTAALAGYSECSIKPELYVATIGDDCGKDPDGLRRLHGTDEVIRVISEAAHHLRYRIDTVISSIKGDNDWTDETKAAAMAEMVKFSAQATAVEKAEFVYPGFQLIYPTLEIDGINELLDQEKKKQQEAQGLNDICNLARELPKVAREQGLQTAVTEAKRMLDGLSKPGGKPQLVPMSVADRLTEHKAYLDQYRGKGPMIGLAQKTLPEVDDKTMGLRGLIILPGPPNTGKSALAHQFGYDIIKNNEDACYVYVALEMSATDHINRMWSRAAGMDYKTFRTGSVVAPEPDRAFELSEITRLNAAEVELNLYGSRILLLDKHNFSEPTTENLLGIIQDFKRSTGCSRCYLLIDYLQRWPVPPELDKVLGSDLQKDDWRMAQMEKLVTSPDDPVVVLSAQSKGEHGGSFGKLSAIKGSGTGSYTPDCALFIRPADEREIYKQRTKYELEPANKPPSRAEDYRERLDELGVYKTFSALGIAWSTLELVKGRDGMERFEIPITFHFRQSSFTPGWDMPGVWINGRNDNAA